MLDLAVLMLNHIQTRAFLDKVPIRRAYSFGFGGMQSGDELSASKASNQVTISQNITLLRWHKTVAWEKSDVCLGLYSVFL